MRWHSPPNTGCKSQRLGTLPTILNLYEWEEKNMFITLKLEGKSRVRTRDLRFPMQAALTTAPVPPATVGSDMSSVLSSCRPTACESNVGLMLSHRLRRRPSLKPMLVQPRVFLGEKNWDAHREILLQYGPVCIPVETRRWPGAVLMLVQYLRRWPNISPALGQCLLFPGKGVSTRPPNKHGSLTTCWFNAGPSSTTLAQHWTSTWWMSRVC